MKPRRHVDTERPDPGTAYGVALALLARRELSTRQMQERLGRRGYDEEAIADTIARLTGERALDDGRVAAAIARTETGFRRRGQMRVRLALERAGIGRELAQQAIDTVFEDLDPDELIEAALRKRLRPDQTIADDREYGRLYRYLVSQGFSSEHALRVLKGRRTRSTP
jgi:regulatory protein